MNSDNKNNDLALHNKGEEGGVTLRELQTRINDWITSLKVGYFSPLSNFARLVEEVGELGRLINAFSGDKPLKKGEDRTIKDLEVELGDILFSVATLANQYDIDLTQSIERMFEKINARDAGKRYEKKETTD